MVFLLPIFSPGLSLSFFSVMDPSWNTVVITTLLHWQILWCLSAHIPSTANFTLNMLLCLLPLMRPQTTSPQVLSVIFTEKYSKEYACNARDPGSIPGSGRSPGKGNGYPLQYSGLENSGDCMSMGSQRVRHDWVTFTFTFKELNSVFCDNLEG